jgi:hypothetical protein
VERLGLAPELPTNTRLSWKGLLGKNTLAYLVHLYVIKCCEYGPRTIGLKMLNVAYVKFKVELNRNNLRNSYDHYFGRVRYCIGDKDFLSVSFLAKAPKHLRMVVR